MIVSHRAQENECHGELDMLNKPRIVISAFFLGLFIVIGALYLDKIRGQATSSLGLYQIIATIIGYMIFSFGAVASLQGHSTYKSSRNILFGGGGLIVAISALADYVSIATKPGFDKFQIIGAAVGIVLVVIGFFLPQNLF
jgi:hypothetical protein